MLSAFTARPIIELRARDRSKIETILAQGIHTPELPSLDVALPSPLPSASLTPR
jgi:hypothetical protein